MHSIRELFIYECRDCAGDLRVGESMGKYCYYITQLWLLRTAFLASKSEGCSITGSICVLGMKVLNIHRDVID